MIGKVAGALCGWAFAGPLGLLFGTIIGHSFDRGLAIQLAPNPARDKAQKAFFDVTFQVIGCLAKADGRVNEQEIQQTRQMMRDMGLSQDQMIRAMHQFNAGKDPNFNLAHALDRFNDSFKGQWPLRKLFIEMLLVAAYADGHMQPQERQLLTDIANELGYSIGKLAEIERQFLAQRQFYHSDAQAHQWQQQHRHNRHTSFHNTQESQLEQAYALLNIPKTASDDQVKKAWRKMMSEHHPDKLASKGLPPDMMQVATEKAKAIQHAYRVISESRNQKVSSS